LGYLLDTDATVHLRDGDPIVRSLLSKLEEVPAISVVTRVELEGGVYARPELSAKRRRAIDALLKECTVHDFTNEIAVAYSEIVAQTGFSRRKMADRMIAATALVHGLTLVTLNVRDFRDVPNLELLEWTRPDSEA